MNLVGHRSSFPLKNLNLFQIFFTFTVQKIETVLPILFVERKVRGRQSSLSSVK